MFVVTISNAQITARQFNGLDCNGTAVDLLADLDSGKAVILHFYMPNCGSCPPPAKKIQDMANNINAMYPGMVKGYAFPYQNSTTCSYSSTWVSSNGLSALYAPMDSGEEHVSHYGGFGMPTIVLLGGLDHKVLFSTMSFSTSDTTIMRDEIITLFGGSTAIFDLHPLVSSFSAFPNPASTQISIRLELKDPSALCIDVTDITGKQILVVLDENLSGVIHREVNTEGFPNGIYFVRLHTNGKTTTQKICVVH